MRLMEMTSISNEMILLNVDLILTITKGKYDANPAGDFYTPEDCSVIRTIGSETLKVKETPDEIKIKIHG